MKYISTLLTIVLAFGLVKRSQGECCRASLVMAYNVANGSCGDTGGRATRGGCRITICADGNALKGAYCGRRSCNIFGCNCGGGCLVGEWKTSFLNRFRNSRITVNEERWNS